MTWTIYQLILLISLSCNHTLAYDEPILEERVKNKEQQLTSLTFKNGNTNNYIRKKTSSNHTEKATKEEYK